MNAFGLPAFFIVLAFIPCVILPLAALVYLFVKERRK